MDSTAAKRAIITKNHRMYHLVKMTESRRHSDDVAAIAYCGLEGYAFDANLDNDPTTRRPLVIDKIPRGRKLCRKCEAAIKAIDTVSQVEDSDGK